MKTLCEQFPTAVEPDGCVSIWPRVWKDDDDIIRADWEHLESEAVKHGVPVDQLKDAINYCWEAWLDGWKSGYLDEATGWHVFCPLGDWRTNDFRLDFTPPESAKKWKLDTYKC